MGRELLSVENGKLVKNGRVIFSGLYLRIFRNEISGVLCDDIQSQKYLNDFLMGGLELESGRIYWEEKRVPAPRAAKIFSEQATFIGKKSKLIDTLTLEDNIFLFTDPSFFIRKAKYRQRFLSLQEKLGVSLPANRRVPALTVKERIAVELLKAFAEGKKLVVLDDLTEYLQKKDTDEIFSLLLRLQKFGMAFLLRIGFEDENLWQIGRVTALKGGRTAAVLDPERRDVRAYVRRMFFEEGVPKPGGRKKGPGSNFRRETILRFENVSTSYLSGISFSVKKGTLLTIHCFDDLSCLQVVGLLKGEIRPVSGSILYRGGRYRVRDVCSAVRQKICFVEQSAYDRMLFPNMSAVENLAIPCDEKIRNFWLFPRYSGSVARQFEKRLGKRALEQQAKNLRSSVLQQIVYYKWLLYSPSVVVCINPFSDVDVYMREKTIEMIRLYRERGISVLIVTSNLYTADKFGGEVVRISKGKLLDGNRPEE